MSAKRAGYVLKPEYQAIEDEFDSTFDDGGCTCFNRPPCGYCTHPGNPLGLEEDDDAWEPELLAAVRDAAGRGGAK